MSPCPRGGKERKRWKGFRERKGEGREAARRVTPSGVDAVKGSTSQAKAKRQRDRVRGSLGRDVYWLLSLVIANDSE